MFFVSQLYFQQPRLEILVDEDVEAEEFEAIRRSWDTGRLTQYRQADEASDSLPHEPVVLARLFQISSQLPEAPLAAGSDPLLLPRVARTEFVECEVRQMAKRVVEAVEGKFFGRETCQALFVEINRQWSIRRHADV